jgi:hypothetical protein
VPCWRRLERRGARRVTDGAAVDHILMFVVRKLDRELKFPSRVSKRKPRFVAWRRLRVTPGTDRRSRAAEKLPPVATHTCIVAWIIIDIGKRYLVTRITRRPVFLRRVRKIRRGHTRIDTDQNKN